MIWVLNQLSPCWVYGFTCCFMQLNCPVKTPNVNLENGYTVPIMIKIVPPKSFYLLYCPLDHISSPIPITLTGVKITLTRRKVSMRPVKFLARRALSTFRCWCQAWSTNHSVNKCLSGPNAYRGPKLTLTEFGRLSRPDIDIQMSTEYFRPDTRPIETFLRANISDTCFYGCNSWKMTLIII